MRLIQINKGHETEILEFLNNRTDADLSKAEGEVQYIINEVKQRGDQALSEFSHQYDGVSLQGTFRVAKKEIDAAYDLIEDDIREALIKAYNNITEFHKRQLELTWTYEKENGAILGQLITPIDSVGLYIPGGKAAYPSTVLMNAIPAKIAGVKRIVMATPPMKDGTVNTYVLAAAKISGIEEIYKIGGAHAIAALAYGTESIKPVCKITGPGNIYVALAKKQVFGRVAIDMIAGPSEICIIADKDANERYIAADLLSQAEHDEMASSILLTNSEELAHKVKNEVASQLSKLKRENIAMMSIQNNGLIVIAEDIDSCFKISNSLAPEHLEILLEDPMNYLSLVTNAGAIFLGDSSPEPLGDYMAGPNHTLPTGGNAKFASPLGVYDFTKRSSIIFYPKDALLGDKDSIMLLAEKEGLLAHGKAIGIRFEMDGDDL